MARVSKTSPFQPKPNAESEKKDEEKSDSSSSTSSSSTSSTSSDQNTQDKKQEKAKGKKPMQAKTRKRKMPLFKSINSLLGAKGTATNRGRWKGKVEAYTTRLWRKNHRRVDVHISSDDEPNNVDPKPKGTQDNMQEKIKGKRPMQAVGLGRGKPLAYAARLLGEHHRRLASKKSNVGHLEVKEDKEDKEEEVVYLSSETDSDEVCKRIKIGRDNNDDPDNNGQGTGTYTNLTSFGIQVVGK